MPYTIASAQDGARMTAKIRPGSIASGPGKGKFPITSQKSVQSAARLIGHAKGVSKKRVAKHILAQAKAKGLKVPPSVRDKALSVEDTDLAGKWRHGWIPLDATAMLVKAKKYKPGGGHGSPGKSRVPDHSLPSGPGRTKRATAKERLSAKPEFRTSKGEVIPHPIGSKVHAKSLNSNGTHGDLISSHGKPDVFTVKQHNADGTVALADRNGEISRVHHTRLVSSKTGAQHAAEAFREQKSGMYSLSEESHARRVADLHRAAAAAFEREGDHRNAKMHRDLAANVEKIARDANTSGEGRKSGVGTMKVKAKAPSKDTAAKQTARENLSHRLDPNSATPIGRYRGASDHKAKAFEPGQQVAFRPSKDTAEVRYGHVTSSSSSHVAIHSTSPSGASEHHVFPTDHRGNVIAFPQLHNTAEDKAYIARQLLAQARDARVETNLKPSVPMREHFANMKRMSPEAAAKARKAAAEGNARFTSDHHALVKRINSTSENVIAYSEAARAMDKKNLAVGDRVALPTGSHTIVGLSKNGKVKAQHDSSGEIVREHPSKMRLVAKASERAKAATATKAVTPPSESKYQITENGPYQKVSEMSKMDLADHKDAQESIAHAAKGLATARQALADQVARTTKVYGDRKHWPASSEYAVRNLEDRVSGIEQSLKDYRKRGYGREVAAATAK